MMKSKILLSVFSLLYLFLSAQENDKNKDGNVPPVAQLKWRGIGPAFTSGRVSDFAVNPQNHSEYYVSFAGGHIWKTQNNGTTFTPVFDKYGSYSIGCLAMDPSNPNVIWAGTGENNHQRSVSYGDGVYKSVDGGKSWKNMGLKDSRQIGMIAIDPRNTDIVFVAAEGSVWGPGGDRGLYRTKDGGKTWERVLYVSENTGVNSVLIDPVNPDIMYATSEQRRRHVHIRIGGGPESAVWKSTDAGNTWRKLTNGLPGTDKGGIGLAISPVDHNYLYAIVEAAMGKSGFFRSTDRGESWEKMSDYHTSGQYYTEIYCDPHDVHTVYSMETVSKVTNDGGKTWKPIGQNKRHVDDHAFWIDPGDTRHFMIGGDGGVYETFDGGAHYIHKTNLPVTQFYRVNVDNDEPFYNIYGGTQDNSSFGGPSRTIYSDGISRCEWTVTLGGDGYWQAIDPDNPDIVYSEYQYGNLFRYDRKSGERIAIKPLPLEGEDTYKWNWNTPFILSPHNSKRLYIAANKVFRSDDRGQSWKVISGDITRRLPRDKWPVMGRYWSVDAVEKNVSTSLFGMAVSLAESPVQEDLLYVGTDDGVIQVTEDAGVNWRKITHFKGVPEYTYVSDILPSKFDPNVVYAAFDNRKRDDFTPYLLKSTDKGKTWKSIAGNLPQDGTVHTIEQDFINPDLLFAGTEHGVYFTLDGGKQWYALKNGMPTVSVRDLVIQKREGDLVAATFGRGFYILDDYSPLREWNGTKDSKARIFPIRRTWVYTPKTRGGYGFGSMPFVAENPPYGAVFTYYLPEVPETRKEARRKKEKESAGKSPLYQPSPKELYDEQEEEPPYLLFTVSDADGNEIRKIPAKAVKGVHRIAWDLTYPRDYPLSVADKFDPVKTRQSGIRVTPGTYRVKMQMLTGGKLTTLVPDTPFKVLRLHNTTLPAGDEKELAHFQNKLNELTRVVLGVKAFRDDLEKRVQTLRKAAVVSENVPPEVFERLSDIYKELNEMQWQLEGERPKASYEEIQPAPMAVIPRLNRIIYVHNQSTSALTSKQKDGYRIIRKKVEPMIADLRRISQREIPEIETLLDARHVPYTPGRLPDFDYE